MPELSIIGRFRHFLYMNKERNNLIEAIQSSGFKTAIVVSGGGSGAAHELLAHPGASRFVLEVQIPYSPEALADYLGESAEQSCSEKTARLMAVRAFERASRFTPPASQTIGLSCTAALQTNRERRGSDRAFICIKTATDEKIYPVEIGKNPRAAQEEHVSAELLKILAQFLGIDSK